jgi:hypothetical protein
MSMLLYFLSDYMVLTVKILKIYKKLDHATINKLNFSVILAQAVVAVHIQI